ncbi:hypothetical protein [Chromobacterium phragmitis]|uniref:Uncharacterized protein n=1 Tax=Chromobacterium phragmitis TaxID=2202141 RepID=A0A344UEX6_9NEIS|nr:hypothetical protein [Chromobacterium phragmitis]AXE33824.1 hypothetical protein DK843_05540 [Chromobacterium phragmitis]
MNESVVRAEPVFSVSLEKALDERMEALRRQVERRAEEIAGEGGGPVDVASLGLALDEALNGRQRWRAGFFELFPPFTCVCAALCLAFAAFGLLFPLLDPIPGEGKSSALVAGFLDIAKIFAGAIVGSTSSVVISAARSRRSG